MAKLSLDTWSDPVQAPVVGWVVIVAGFAAWSNVTAIVLLVDTPVAPSVGVVELTFNGVNVVNDSGEPNAVPPAFEAIAQK